MNRNIAVKRYKRRFLRPLQTARGGWSVREGFLLRVEQDGFVGYGEVAPLPEFGSETVGAAGNFLRQLAKDPEMEVPDDLPGCAFGLSAALRPRGAAQGYPVCALLPAGSKAVANAERKVAAGYSSLKWKIGVAPIADEIVLARRLLDGLAPGCQIRLDANGSLTPMELEQWLDLVATYHERIDYIEQPLACGEEDIMARYSAGWGVDIALDESLNGEDGARWLEPGAWGGPLVIKAALMGDVGKLMARLEPVCEQVVLSSVFETGIGLENSLGVVDCLPKLTRPIGFDTVDAFDDALSPIVSAPTICEASRRAYDPEKLWNSI